MGVYSRAEPVPPTAAIRLYRKCVALKELGERLRLDPLIAIGKAAVAVAGHFVIAHGGKR